MAGFGFSPSDIVEFGKFANNVRIALKEEGGSKSEYLEAIGWCETFEKVLDTINGLQRAKVPDAFSDQYGKQVEQIIDYINAFRKQLKKYDKALGETSAKGAHHGTARKILWPLDAAKKLADFARIMQLRIESLQMLISGRIMESLDSMPTLQRDLAVIRSGFQGFAQQQSSMEMAIRRSEQQTRASALNLDTILQELRFLREGGSPLPLNVKVHNLGESLVQLLAQQAKSTPSLPSVPRIWTMPDGMEYADDLQSDEADPSKPQRTSLPSTQMTNGTSGDGKSHLPDLEEQNGKFEAHTDWLQGTNELLTALGMENLEPEHTANLEAASLPQELPASTSSHENKDIASESRPTPASRGATRSRRVPRRSKSNPMAIAAELLGTAATISQFLDTFGYVSTTRSGIGRVVNRLQLLKNVLLTTARSMEFAGERRASRSSDEAAEACLSELNILLHEINFAVQPMRIGDKHGIIRVSKATLTWMLHKDKIHGMLEEADYLQQSLASLLQLRQFDLQHAQMEAQAEMILRVNETHHTVSDIQRRFDKTLELLMQDFSHRKTEARAT